MKKAVLAFLMLLCFCISCAAPGAAESNLFLEDYDQLWEDLQKNYPFFPVLEQQGVDVDAIRQTYRTYAQNADTTEEFMKTLDLLFAKLYCFAHLSLIHKDRYVMLVESEALRDSVSFAPWLEVLHDPVTEQAYASLSASEPPRQTDAPPVTHSYYEDLHTAYFRFPVMDGQDQTIIADYLSQLSNVEHIIIDVTGNPGGSTLYWEEVIVKPFGGSWSAEFPVYYPDSPLVQKYYGSQNLQPIVETNNLPPFVSALNAKWFSISGWDLHCGEPTVKNGVHAQRWVLIDGGGYSATEAFASFCKLTGWAKLVGTPTAGDGLGGQPILLQLKNTGLLVYFSTAMATNPDGSLNTAQGVSPDYNNPPKQSLSPLELCLNTIQSETP